MLQLSTMRPFQGPGYGLVSRMTSSLRNLMKHVEVTEPRMTSHVMIPFIVRTGRIEYCFPQTKNLLCTHLLPTKAKLHVLPDVFRFHATSSKNMSTSGCGTSLAVVFMNVVHRMPFLSRARIETTYVSHKWTSCDPYNCPIKRGSCVHLSAATRLLWQPSGCPAGTMPAF